MHSRLLETSDGPKVQISLRSSQHVYRKDSCVSMYAIQYGKLDSVMASQEISCSYHTHIFIVVFTKARHLTLLEHGEIQTAISFKILPFCPRLQALPASFI